MVGGRGVTRMLSLAYDGTNIPLKTDIYFLKLVGFYSVYKNLSIIKSGINFLDVEGIAAPKGESQDEGTPQLKGE